MSKSSVVFGLEMGRQTVRAVAGFSAKGLMEIVGVGTSPVFGVGADGIVLRPDALAESMRWAVADAEKQAGTIVSAVNLALPGSLTQAREVVGVVHLRGNLATPADLERASQTALAQADRDLHLLHTRLKQIVVDSDPWGRAGAELCATFVAIGVAGSSLLSYVQATRLAGLDVAAVIPAPIAAADAALSSEERARGVLLAHLEGDMADVVVYRQSALQHAESVAVAGLAASFEALGGADALGAGIVLTGEPYESQGMRPLAGLPLRWGGSSVRADLAAGIGLLWRAIEDLRDHRERRFG